MFRDSNVHQQHPGEGGAAERVRTSDQRVPAVACYALTASASAVLLAESAALPLSSRPRLVSGTAARFLPAAVDAAVGPFIKRLDTERPAFGVNLKRGCASIVDDI